MGTSGAGEVGYTGGTGASSVDVRDAAARPRAAGSWAGTAAGPWTGEDEEDAEDAEDADDAEDAVSWSWTAEGVRYSTGGVGTAEDSSAHAVGSTAADAAVVCVKRAAAAGRAGTGRTHGGAKHGALAGVVLTTDAAAPGGAATAVTTATHATPEGRAAKAVGTGAK